MPINENELRAAIEAVLLVAGEPITVKGLLEVFGEKEQDSIVARLEEIRVALEQAEGGILLEQAAGGYRLVTRPEYDGYLKSFFSRQGEGRLSIAALETLSIVAYKQPITAPEIADIRGVNSAGVLRTLLDRKLIRIAGRKNVVGSPFLYKTTRDFLMHFGLNTVQDLPRLEEFAEILGEGLADELLESTEEAGLPDEILGDAESGAGASNEKHYGEADNSGAATVDSDEAVVVKEVDSNDSGTPADDSDPMLPADGPDDEPSESKSEVE